MTSVATAGAHSLYIGANPLKSTTTFAELERELRSRHSLVVLGLREPQSDKVEFNPAGEREVLPAHEVIYLAPKAVLEG
ncbi:MAG: hypothetical protein JRH20_24310 [Deltaproteobacteria bacterium]|nr:hypothetical protein [Deltaproteobacteria bacterium]